MEQSSDVKAIAPIQCPHCEKDVIVSFRVPTPSITSVLTMEAIEVAKKATIDQIKARNFEGENKRRAEDIIAWIEKPDTIFGPEDAEQIINSLEEAIPDAPTEEDKAE
jgi:hypothetical protein